MVPEGDRWPDAIPASRLPSPLPEEVIPVALVTPRGGFLWKPLDRRKRSTWARRVNRLIDRYRGGHSVVMMDAHF